MTQAAPTHADRVLDAIQLSEFQALLEGAEAPVDEFSLLSLVDLDSDHQHALGEAQRGSSVEGVARDVFADGDGQQLAHFLQEEGADEALLGLDIAGQLVLLLPGDEAHVVAVQVRSRTDIAQLQRINSQLHAHLASSDAATLLAKFDMVHWVLRLQLDTGSIVESLVRPNASHKVHKHLAQIQESKLGPLLASLLGGDSCPVIDKAVLSGAIIKVADRFMELRRLPFVSRLVVALEMQGKGQGHPLWGSLNQAAEDMLRGVLGKMLSSGMQTQMEPFPQTDVEFEHILQDLRALSEQDLDQRLILGGFADHEVDGRDGAMRCRECIYYLPHRRWCDLPELPLPVEADWYCRLWKL